MKFAIGKKARMTEVFEEEGAVSPVTEIILEPMTVTRVNTQEKDGYSAVQVGYGETKKAKNKAVQGVMKDKTYLGMKEFRNTDEYSEGDIIEAENVFTPGDVVTVSGVSKGKGFQGVVKRHGFAGAPKTHGQKHTLRAPGAIGGGLPNRVPKGKKMAGRMGGERVTVKGLTVVRVNSETKSLLVKGSIPGRIGSLIEVRGM